MRKTGIAADAAARCSLPLILYQPGKVGSVSVRRTLEENGYFVIHLHSLPGRDPRKQVLLSMLERGTTGWRIITLVRDPVGRNISNFFEGMIRPGNAWYIGNEAYVRSLRVSELIERFFAVNMHIHLSFLHWFEKQLTRYFFFAPLSESFDPSRGYGLYANRLGRLLLLRLEDISPIGEKALSGFIGHAPGRIQIRRANNTNNKWYGDRYRDFKDQIVCPREYLEAVYENKYARRFYSQEEINRFRKRWRFQQHRVQL